MKLARFLLFPFAIVYDLITSIRNFLFDKGVFKSISFDIPVISVGNLNVGGTGKTPQIEYLIRLLSGKNRVAVLSRGYKRSTKEFLLLNNSHTAVDVGDEPLQFFKKYTNIQVAVDTNRVNGIQKLLAQTNPSEIVLLDDAFQHRKVKAGFSILLTKYDDLFTHDFLLPTGNLRENRSGANRADTIIVTKCPKDLSISKQEIIANKVRFNSSQSVFFTAISYADTLGGYQKISISNLKDYQLVLVTGIANPSPLLQFLDENECRYVHLKFSDHYQFTARDIKEIQQEYQQIPSTKKLIVTTEKDVARLADKIQNICYLPIETSFLNNESSLFDKEILDFIQ